jgi:D-alanine-D-alanine ligase
MTELVMTKLLPVADYGRVAVVMGGTSSEREISLISGRAVLESLLRSGVDAVGIDADSTLLQQLRDLQPQRVFIILHGRDGEDGKLQGALEWMDLPYTGSGVLASALAMDKVRSKQLWLSLGLATAEFVLLTEQSDFAAVINKLGPCFVKPVCEGSSIGIGGADTAQQLESAWRRAKQFDAEVMAERWIRGREFTVAILNGQALPVVEMRTDNTFYDFEAKYVSNDTRYQCPAQLDAEKTAEIQQLALAAYQSLGCEGWGRVDVMQDADGRFWLLEVNTAPGMTSHSLVPMAAKAVGMNFDELVLQILHTSVRERA